MDRPDGAGFAPRSLRFAEPAKLLRLTIVNPDSNRRAQDNTETGGLLA
jgi:hypothetical protein